MASKIKKSTIKNDVKKKVKATLSSASDSKKNVSEKKTIKKSVVGAAVRFAGKVKEKTSKLMGIKKKTVEAPVAKQKTEVKAKPVSKPQVKQEAKQKPEVVVKPEIKSKPEVRVKSKTASIKVVAPKKEEVKKAVLTPKVLDAKEAKKEILKVEAINTASSNKRPSDLIIEPPQTYGVTRVVLMVRDPEWAFAYWEVTFDTIKNAREKLGESSFNQSRHIIRIYDITDVNFNGYNANASQDIEVGPFSKSWYLRMPASNRSYVVEVGMVTPTGEFFVFARSNCILMPSGSVSDVLDEEWATINFDELFRMSGGLGVAQQGIGSAFIMEEISKRMKMDLEMGSGSVSSFGGIKVTEKGRNFWLVVNTELIVYGATEPDATVTVQDIPIKLNKDGTFSLRFALPDGLQIIPVKAKSSDGLEERKITPIVKKSTEI